MTTLSAAPGGKGIGSVSGLVISNNVGALTTKVDVSANCAVLMDPNGRTVPWIGIAGTMDLTTVGPLGMDTGARPTNGWVHLFLISDGVNFSAIASTSATNPTMPGAYTYKFRIGAMRCDGSQNLMRTRQIGDEVQYLVTAATNTANFPIMRTGGAFGTNTVGNFAAIAVSNFVPPTAARIRGILTGDTLGNFLVSPNNAVGPQGSTTNPVPLTIGIPSGSIDGFPFDFVLESTSIYGFSGATSVYSCTGWKDNL